MLKVPAAHERRPLESPQRGRKYNFLQRAAREDEPLIFLPIYYFFWT